MHACSLLYMYIYMDVCVCGRVHMQARTLLEVPVDDQDVRSFWAGVGDDDPVAKAAGRELEPVARCEVLFGGPLIAVRVEARGTPKLSGVGHHSGILARVGFRPDDVPDTNTQTLVPLYMYYINPLYRVLLRICAVHSLRA